MVLLLEKCPTAALECCFCWHRIHFKIKETQKQSLKYVVSVALIKAVWMTAIFSKLQ